MKDTLIPGVQGEHKHRVVSENLVSHFNPKGPAVLGTPFLLLLMESAAWVMGERPKGRGWANKGQGDRSETGQIPPYSA